MSDRNEAETRAELIDPALKTAGWGVTESSRVRREVIAPGRILGAGKRAKEDISDYVLMYKNQKLAVIEAKRESLADREGLGQAKQYAQKLQTPFAYSTNGRGIYQVQMTFMYLIPRSSVLSYEPVIIYPDRFAPQRTMNDFLPYLR